MRKMVLFIILYYCMFLGNLFCDGFIVVDPMPPIDPVPHKPFPLEVKYHYVDVKIKGIIAETIIDQVFYNPSKRRMEGTYLFPVPKGAVINNFSMFINGKETKAELLDAKKARKIYEDIVRAQLDPAILEYDGLNLFKVRIFPIEPLSEKRVKIRYNEKLEKNNGIIEYLYPLNTEKFSSKPLQEVKINVELEAGEKIKNIFSTSHAVVIKRQGEQKAKISYNESNTKPDRDFKLYYNSINSKVGLALVTHKEMNGNGYFFMDISPGFAENKADVIAKDIAFVLDTSGSMAGEKLKQAKKSLLFCIENLNQNDNFDIIKFSTEAEALFTKLQPVNKKSLSDAKNFINNLEAIGGTNIDEALEIALSRRSRNNVPYIIVFITDGKPTIGETNEEKLLSKINKINQLKTRIFTFGIGNEINTHLLDKLTRLTRAYRTYVAPQEDIELKISDFYLKIKSPVLTNLKLTTNKIKLSKIYPRDLPDLFKGSNLNITGVYTGNGNATVTLEGMLNNVKKTYQYQVFFPAESKQDTSIPALWAARRIGYLLDQIRLNGESKELVDEITLLARQYGIITPYTSYLIVEDEITRTNNRSLDARFQTLNQMADEEMEVITQSKFEYKKIQEKSGKDSVRASKELQALNKVDNIGDTRQGEERLKFKDNSGDIKNLTSQIRNIQGRAVYQTDKFWIDSAIQQIRKVKVNRIKFASQKYFDLLKKEPEAALFLALGKNVRFVINNRIYEIHE